MDRIAIRDGIKPRGRVEVFVTKGRPFLVKGKRLPSRGGVPLYSNLLLDFSATEIVSKFEGENIVVNQGKDKVIQALTSGNINQIGRMAVGDRGTLPSDPTTPKVPEKTFTTLYNEVYRADMDGITIEVGTPNVHEVKFVKTFNAIDFPLSAFSNQSKPVINEVGLITFDAGVEDLPRAPVMAPGTPLADEKLFSIRTFKSVPFEAANEISVTIRYTIFVE